MRCYLLHNGHIGAVEVLDGASDQDIIDQAREVFDKRKREKDYDGFEVWERDRFVYRYPELPSKHAITRTDVRPPYHLYLLGEDGIMRGSFEFWVESDEVAYELAEIAFDACSDRAVQFELWCGSRRVRPTSIVTLVEVITNRQAQLVALEEKMHDSRWAVAKSERLLARLKNLKTPKVTADRYTVSEPRPVK